MSLKKIAEKVLPEAMIRKIKKKRSEAYIKKLIAEWEQKGKPAPTPHIVKQYAIRDFQKRFGISTFIETGTYKGDMVTAQQDVFKKIISIELGKELHAAAVKLFEKFPHIQILQGDSGEVLQNVTPKLSERALFFLDGHYSAGVTAKGEKNCPIFNELDAIFKNDLGHVILIDDARCFVGKDDYPAMNELEKYIQEKNSKYKIEVKNDIIHVFIPI
jgi:hypothetical protein